MVFTKPGTYDVGGGKQKTVFSSGTVYFRYGPKSEPGNSDDLEHFVERRLNQIRKTWMDDIAKVFGAPGNDKEIILAISNSRHKVRAELRNGISPPQL